jgi:hypothetical protein
MRGKIMAVLGQCAQSNSAPDQIREREEEEEKKRGMV